MRVIKDSVVWFDGSWREYVTQQDRKVTAIQKRAAFVDKRASLSKGRCRDMFNNIVGRFW